MKFALTIAAATSAIGAAAYWYSQPADDSLDWIP